MGLRQTWDSLFGFGEAEGVQVGVFHGNTQADRLTSQRAHLRPAFPRDLAGDPVSQADARPDESGEDRTFVAVPAAGRHEHRVGTVLDIFPMEVNLFRLLGRGHLAARQKPRGRGNVDMCRAELRLGLIGGKMVTRLAGAGVADGHHDRLGPWTKPGGVVLAIARTRSGALRLTLESLW